MKERPPFLSLPPPPLSASYIAWSGYRVGHLRSLLENRAPSYASHQGSSLGLNSALSATGNPTHLSSFVGHFSFRLCGTRDGMMERAAWLPPPGLGCRARGSFRAGSD